MQAAASNAKRATDDDAVTQIFQRDGVVCLKGICAPDQVEALREATDRVLTDGAAGRLRDGLVAREGRSFGVQYMYTWDKAFNDYVFRSAVAAACARLLVTQQLRLFKDHLFVKEPGGDEPTPWHQDLPYWCVAGSQICSAWLALDPVDRDNGAVEFVRGSHLWNKRFAKTPFAGSKASTVADVDTMPDIEAQRGDYDIAQFDLEPGDCVVFHALIVHGAPKNPSTRRRRGLSTRWLGDDVTYNPHPDASRPYLDPGLRPGDPVASPVFPLVWPRPQQR